LPHAKAIHYCCFDDIEDEDSTTSRSPRAEDVAAAFTFIDRLLPGAPREPLMIHCEQGVSRSTALALSWVYGHLPGDSERGIQAIDIILALRPLAKPNRLVLRLGLVHFVTASEANRLADWIVREPRLARNRFEASEPE
jgi:predicted protein tyrosine phosphatase